MPKLIGCITAQIGLLQATYSRNTRRVEQATRIANHASADDTTRVNCIVVATTIAINIEVHKAPTSIDRDAETTMIAPINLTAVAAMEAMNGGHNAMAMIAAQR